MTSNIISGAMYPGISTQVFGAQALSALHASAVREFGFKAAEIYGMPPHLDLLDDKWIAYSADHFRDEGLRVSAVHVPYKGGNGQGGRARRLSVTSGDPEIIEATMKHALSGARAAHVFGAPLVILHCGAYGDKFDGAVVSNMVSFFISLDRALEGSNVRFAIENVATRVSDPGFLARLFDKYALSRFGVCLDIAHANIGGDPVKEIRNCGSGILHVHVSDNNGEKDEHAVPFDGNIDWKGVMLALRDVGYKGCMNFEPRGSEAPDVLMRRCREAYDRLDAMLRS